MLSDFRFRLRALLRRSSVEAELDAELREHLAREIDKHVARGVPRDEAARRARLDLGGLEHVKDECRDARGLSLLETTAGDARHALRLLRTHKSFTAISLLALALGIGAATAVFSVVDTVLLEKPPYPQPERIVMLQRVPPPDFALGYDTIPWGGPEVVALHRLTDTFDAIGAFVGQSINLTGTGDPLRVDAVRASAGLFRALGLQPALGRVYTTGEDRPGHEHVVVLSDQLWRDRFGADPGLLGRAITLNDEPYTVVGVMPPGFSFPRANEMPPIFAFAHAAQLWIPLALPAEPPGPPAPSELAVIARLKPGVTLAQAQAALALFEARQVQQDPRVKGWMHAVPVPLADQIAGRARRPLLLLLGAVGLVLFICCANIAGLLLTRGLSRRREFAVRAALGAGPRRIARQLLVEGLLLSTLGGLAGIGVAAASLRLLRAFGPSGLPRLGQVTLNLPVLLFALGTTILTGVFFGMTPVLGGRRLDLSAGLREGGPRAGRGRASGGLRGLLLVGEIALAMVLVVASALLVQSFLRLLETDAGFNASHALTFEISLPSTRYPTQDAVVGFYRRVLDRLQAIPGVQAAGLGETVPMGGAGESTAFQIVGRPRVRGPQAPATNYTVVSPGYFTAVGTPLLRGRGLRDTDTRTSPAVAVINQSLAAKYWPHADPLGQQVRILHPITIVGIIADVKHESLRETPSPEIYVPYTQNPWPSMLKMHVALRTQAAPLPVAASARRAIQAVDPDVPLAGVTTLEAIVDESMRQSRFSMLLIAAFGILAVLLAAIGLYGLIANTVEQRTQELGIRMALGARPHELVRLVLVQGGRLAAIGIALGVAAALAVAQTMAGFLYGVPPGDPSTFAGVALLLLAVTLIACAVPARRASRIDPMIALRRE
jgi:predicted permease